MKRISIALGTILLVVGAAATFTSKTFHVEVEIAAPPEAIWAVLTDTARYSEWNPTQVEVRGTHRVGESVSARFAAPGGEVLEIEMTVRDLRTAQLLRQVGGVPGVITFDHSWILKPVNGGTRVIQHEVDRGIYLWFWDSSWIEPAYQRAGEALRDRVIALESAGSDQRDASVAQPLTQPRHVQKQGR